MLGCIGWKSWGISVALHVLVLTFIWVGFSVSTAQDPVGFYYTGTSIPAQNVHALLMTDQVVEDAAADPYPAAYFVPWINMRDVNKPRR